MSKPILLTSVEALNAHVATLPPTPDVDVWWECPNCGAENYGILLGSTTPCSACRDYYHPQAGMTPKSRTDYQIEKIEQEIGSLENDIALLEDEIQGIWREINTKKDQIRHLMKSRGRQ